MKKIVSTLIIASFLNLSVYVSAAPGDIIGNIYSTDIKSCINGVWVDSYNIGGKTVVILEDITDTCYYNDDLRTLICYGLSPYSLKAGEQNFSDAPGKIIGKIYESDIKTYIRGKEIPAYSLDGKMAVAIEDLGGDKEFSDILGRYLWDADERTISLEFAYDISTYDLLCEKHLEMNLDYDTHTITFSEMPILYGQTKNIGNNSAENRIDFTYNDEVICRYLMYDEMNFWNNDGVYVLQKNPTRLYYYDLDKMTELLSDVEPAQPTYIEWLDYFENYTVSQIKDRVETDDYIFMYMFFANSHGGSDGLIKLSKKDGTKTEFDDSFQSVSFYGQKRFENVKIDKENEKVYLHYDIDYVIDLKTDKIEPLEDKEDLLLINVNQ